MGNEERNLIASWALSSLSGDKDPSPIAITTSHVFQNKALIRNIYNTIAVAPWR